MASDAPEVATGRAGRRAIIANAGVIFVAFVVGGLTGDILQVFATHVLQLSPEVIGLILGALVLVVPLQAGGIAFVEKWGKRGLLVRGYTITLVGLGLLAVVPWAVAAHRTVGTLLFAAVVLLAAGAQSISWGSAWQAWIRELTLRKERGRFLSRMRLTTQLCTAAAMFLVGLLVGERMSHAEFLIILAAAGCYLVFAIVQFRRIPEPSWDGRDRGEDPPTFRVADIAVRLRALVRDRLLLRLAVVQWLQGFLTVPLVVLYLIAPLGFSGREVAWQLGLRNLAVVGSLLLCGRAIDRWGAVAVLRWGSLCTAATLVGWTVVPEAGEAPFGLGFYVAAALVMANGGLANSLAIAYLTAVHNTVTDEDAVASFSVVSMMDSLRQRIVIAVAGAVIAASTVAWFEWGAFAVDAYRAYLLLGLPAAALIWWLSRPVAAVSDAH